MTTYTHDNKWQIKLKDKQRGLIKNVLYLVVHDTEDGPFVPDLDNSAHCSRFDLLSVLKHECYTQEIKTSSVKALESYKHVTESVNV